MCPDCGKENKDDADLCTQCGAPLGEQESPSSAKSSRGKPWMLYAIVFAVVVAILIPIAYCVLSVKIPPSVVTAGATDITANGAVFNGDLTQLGRSKSVRVSFEWGTSSESYPYETDPLAMDASGEFSFELAGLTSKTTYYYRAKAVGDATGYGVEKSFTTP